VSAHPLLDAIAKAQYDLTSAQAWLAEVRRQVAALNLEPPERHACSECGLSFAGAGKLAEHGYLQHDGPEPAHWVEAERASIDPEASAA